MKTNKINKIIEEIEDTECITEMCKQKPHLVLRTQCGIGKYVFNSFCYRNNQFVLEFKLVKDSNYENSDKKSPIEYSASKSAIISMSRYFAKYLSGRKIRVNCISPGGIKEDEQSSIFADRYRSSCINKGLLDASDLVGTLMFLISDQSKYMNGQNVILHDGWSL